MKKLILIALTLILAACSVTKSNEYAQNLDRWQSAKISHYQYQLTLSCFCPYGDIMPLTVEVMDGKAVSMTSVDGKTLDLADPSYGEFASYATIDQVFVQTKSALEKADEVKLSYDPQYGFPSAVMIDFIKKAMDDELSIYVENFKVLE